MSEAYFHEHAPAALVSELEKMISSATPPASFAPPVPASQAHRGKAVANRNAAGLATLRGMVPRG